MHQVRKSPDSCIYNLKQVAARLGHSVPWFKERQSRLEQLQFPKKDQILGGWPVLSVERWINNRSGEEDEISMGEKIALGRINGENQSAVC